MRSNPTWIALVLKPASALSNPSQPFEPSMPQQAQAQSNLPEASNKMTRCPGCGSESARVFFFAPNVPVFCNVLWDSREAATGTDRASMELAHCPQCDLVFNDAFDPELMAYSPQYENSLDCSPRFREYRAQLAQRLVDDFELRGKRIVEIGCGRGDFLRLLADQTENECVGFDPSFDPNNDPPPTHPRVTLRSENYGPSHRGFDAEFVCCRHVLEHISAPLEFVKQVRETLGPESKAGVYFEVPNALYTLERMGIWDLIYEHCLYFTPTALTALFERADFKPLRVESVYDGQFISLDATGTSTGGSVDSASGDTASLVDQFKNAYDKKVAHWKAQFAAWRQEGRRAVIWGAGSKGVTFLNVMNQDTNQPEQCVVTHAVDVNSRKQGRYVTGTGQQIVHPSELKRIKPDRVLIMNAIYASEIQSQLEDLQIDAEILAV